MQQLAISYECARDRNLTLYDEASNKLDEDNMVLNVGGGEKHPFVMKVKINNHPFSTMINSGSPITRFTQTDKRAMITVDVIFARSISVTVHYNNMLLNLLEITTVDVQVKSRKER